MRWHWQVQGRRLRLVDAASQVVVGTVARAEIATDPVFAQIGRRDFRAEGRRATQVGAEADSSRISGLIERTSSRRRAAPTPWIRVRQLALDLFQIAQDFLRTATMNTGWPRHSATICWPGSTLLILTFTGAPAAFALALGNHDPTNGTAAPTALQPHHGCGCYEEATPACIHAVIAHSVLSHQLFGLLNQASTKY
jgi:hypothetical protein